MPSYLYSTVPSEPPGDITVVDQTLFNITISWQPIDCLDQNGNITGYVIKYNSEEKFTMSNNYTLTDLQPSTTYLIQVAANNTVGTGVFGNISVSILLCKLLA